MATRAKATTKKKATTKQASSATSPLRESAGKAAASKSPAAAPAPKKSPGTTKGKTTSRPKRAPHTRTQALKALKAAGTAQNVKVYRNHGVKGELYGVSYAFLKQLEKQVEHDLALAEALWATGNHDARVFACWIADADEVTTSALDAWSDDVDNHVLANEVVSLAAYTSLGADLSRSWRKRKAEWRSTLGWSVVGSLAMQPSRGPAEGGLADEELVECLEVIAREIHGAPNRTRHAMNRALIAIGCRKSTSRAALAVAKRVGPVEVDHGPTSCKTDIAYDTIRKTLERYAKQGKLPTDGTAGKRRRHC